MKFLFSILLLTSTSLPAWANCQRECFDADGATDQKNCLWECQERQRLESLRKVEEKQQQEAEEQEKVELEERSREAQVQE